MLRKGCAEDQTIEHTCCLKLEHKAGDSEIQMACTTHRKHLHHEQNVQPLSKENSTKIVPYGATPSNSDHLNQKYHISLQPVIQEQRSCGSNQENPTEINNQSSLIDRVPDQLGNSTNIGFNTCPGPREVRQVTHIEPVEVCEKASKSSSEAHPAGAVQTMFVVTFDDSVCNTTSGTISVHQGKPVGTSRQPHSSGKLCVSLFV